MQAIKQRSALVGAALVMWSCLTTAAGIRTVDAEDRPPAFGVFAVPSDVQMGERLHEVLNAGDTGHEVATFESLLEAVDSDAEVLFLFMPRAATPYPDEVVQKLKQKKAIGVGYGAAQIFGQLEMEINYGACAHFGDNIPSINIQKNLLLGKSWEDKQIATYDAVRPSDNFGMFIPPYSEMRQFVDVIARIGRDANYAPIVRQNNYVMIGITAGTGSWSDDYRALLRDIAFAMRKSEQKPFSTARFPELEPGTYDFTLGQGRSTKEAFGKTFHFKFTRPTRFSATLAQIGSKNMMMFFMGRKGRLHLTRKDAKGGEPLTITVEITQDDLKRIGDTYWSLRVTNFDRQNTADCVLSVHYEVEEKLPE